VPRHPAHGFDPYGLNQGTEQVPGAEVNPGKVSAV
jgi:hypothetical protein